MMILARLDALDENATYVFAHVEKLPTRQDRRVKAIYWGEPVYRGWLSRWIGPQHVMTIIGEI
jgi:hypothetical protein